MQKLRKKIMQLLVFICITFCFIGVNSIEAEAKAAKSYTISTSSKTYKSKYEKYSTYNNNTKHYYLIRSYLEQLEKDGGGTLTLKKGTYTITNVLYVPSNVTIVFNDGVVINKGTKTGTSKLKASKSIFQLIRPSRASKTGVYGGYSGEKNISFIGKGTVIIDLKYDYESLAIIAGHNKNIKIENITFKNMYSGHFIEMDATDTATIKKCTFTGSKASPNLNKEAINLDTPDKETTGWSQKWSKYDKTANKNITIDSCKFYNLDRAIGTHKYSENKLHTNITIKNNVIDKTRSDAIRVMNWKNAKITNNTIKNISKSSKKYRAILASGAINPTFTNNKIENISRPIQFMPWKNEGPGSKYKVIYNEISDANITAMQNNTLKDVDEEYIRINKKYNEFSASTTLVYVGEQNKKNFTLSTSSNPFKKLYKDYSTYNKDTKHYYMIRSYLEELERQGGGTITLKAGTYYICSTLYVPSNVTIKLLDGAIIKKTTTTGTSKITASKSLFQLISPSKSGKANAVSGYSGEKNISIIGEGTAAIDINNVSGAIAIVAGNNKSLNIKGINFKNLNNGHYIVLSATTGTKISGNKFINEKSTGSKEAINLVVNDSTTNTFNYQWSKKDKTVNKDVIIDNNTFNKLGRAIGSSKYTEKKYHLNITIKNNIISNITSDAIKILNWENTIIENNKISNIGSMTDGKRAILASGAINPQIQNNTIKSVARVAQFMPAKNSGDGTNYSITYNELSDENKAMLINNNISDVTENIIRINNIYNVFDKDTEKIQLNL